MLSMQTESNGLFFIHNILLFFTIQPKHIKWQTDRIVLFHHRQSLSMSHRCKIKYFSGKIILIKINYIETALLVRSATSFFLSSNWFSNNSFAIASRSIFNLSNMKLCLISKLTNTSSQVNA